MLRIAGIQMQNVRDKEKNIDKAIALLKIAADRGAKIICYPELFNTHWFPFDVDDEHFKLAESEDGLTISKMRSAAKQNKVTLICPIFEKGESGDYYNSAFIIGSDGELIGKYQKAHIPSIPYWEEKHYFSTGATGFTVFEAQGVTFGVMICWDNFFPEAARILALKGAQIVFCPTAAAFASHSKWETVIRANSMVNGMYAFRVNRVGKENDILNFYGKSFCSSPDGRLLDEPSGSQEGVVIVDIDLNEIKKTRKIWSFFKERKPELYKDILDLEIKEKDTVSDDKR